MSEANGTLSLKIGEGKIVSVDEIIEWLVLTNDKIRYLKATRTMGDFLGIAEAAAHAYIQGYNSGVDAAKLKKRDDRDFKSYDATGVCGLCGSASCRGGCFK